MTRTLYTNKISWAKAYTPFQFNAGIQSTQSVELLLKNLSIVLVRFVILKKQLIKGMKKKLDIAS